MLLRVVVIFLLCMVVLAWVSRWRLPGTGSGPRRLSAGRCPACGAPRAGRGPCPCGRE